MQWTTLKQMTSSTDCLMIHWTQLPRRRRRRRRLSAAAAAFNWVHVAPRSERVIESKETAISFHYSVNSRVTKNLSMVIHCASHFKWNAVKLMNAPFLINSMCFPVINIHSLASNTSSLSPVTLATLNSAFDSVYRVFKTSRETKLIYFTAPFNESIALK